MAAKLSWRERLASHKDLPKVKPIPVRIQKKNGEGTIAIPSPQEVDEVMRCIATRYVATTAQMSESIARKHKATIGCNLTTGIFAWIAANAAHEATA